MSTFDTKGLQRRRCLVAAGAAALLSLAAAGSAVAQTKWDLASAYLPSNFHTQTLAQLVDEVDKATGGQLKITLHSNSSLFKAPEIKRAVQGGQAQAGEILMVIHENENPVLGVDGVPFLATSYDDARRLYAAQRPALQRFFERQGMQLLYSVPWPAQGLYSRKPVESVAELRGLKWRAYSPATARLGELMGAQAVNVVSAELSQALATGVVDAFITSSQTGVDSRVYEHLKFFYDLRAWIPKNAVLVNIKAFQALPKAQQEALTKAAAAAEERGWKASIEMNEASKRTLASNGVTVQAPSAKLDADFRQLGSVMLQEWRKKAGPELDGIVTTYQPALASQK
jgi:TRAP-type C4-dicarboxylate transport system substrate-binding protein